MNRLTIDREFVASQIPPRRSVSHKGMNGVACIVGGSRTYHGAPYFAAMGAMRTGLDLVYLGVPAVISTAVRALSPDIIVFPLPDGKLTSGSISKLVNWLPEVDCVGVGPGLGPQDEARLVRCLDLLSTKAKKCLVVDADALRPKILSLASKTAMVVTPHAGEFERLFQVKLSAETDSRVETVVKKATENNLTVLLKGPTDIISDGSSVGLNTTHSPSMTVGGTGDVLTGITTGLASKGIRPFEAACCAAYVNGLAGVRATSALGLHIVASDVVDQIPAVMKEYDRLE